MEIVSPLMPYSLSVSIRSYRWRIRDAPKHDNQANSGSHLVERHQKSRSTLRAESMVTWRRSSVFDWIFGLNDAPANADNDAKSVISSRSDVQLPYSETT
jgi:hypothetical protein